MTRSTLATILVAGCSTLFGAYLGAVGAVEAHDPAECPVCPVCPVEAPPNPAMQQAIATAKAAIEAAKK